MCDQLAEELPLTYVQIVHDMPAKMNVIHQKSTQVYLSASQTESNAHAVASWKLDCVFLWLCLENIGEQVCENY